MKRYELLSEKERVFDLSIEICNKISEKIECENCPFTERCKRGHNGVFDYLMEEVSENG